MLNLLRKKILRNILTAVGTLLQRMRLINFQQTKGYIPIFIRLVSVQRIFCCYQPLRFNKRKKHIWRYFNLLCLTNMTIFQQKIFKLLQKNKKILPRVHTLYYRILMTIQIILLILWKMLRILQKMMIVQICLMIYKMALEEFLDLLRMKVSIRFYQK